MRPPEFAAMSLPLPAFRAAALAGLLLLAIGTALAGEHFHPQGKPPSAFTMERQGALRASLPFEDERDFEESRRGFIAAPADPRIMNEAGGIAWDMGSYEWLMAGEDFDSIHPSLQRQAILNMAYGLYEVVPDRIYQVRGFDLANMTLVKGDSGWIVFDTLTTRETAAAAMALVDKQLGEFPVVAVVYSHSHADHFGGVRGVVDEADVQSGKVPVIAPAGFMDHAIAENVYAGNAMSRRLFYQYGMLLPHHPAGHVDQAIGKTIAVGNVGLIAPTRVIEADLEELTIDGVRMVFHNTPGTEAPAEMNTWFPDWKVFWAAENISATIHNIYTLRGALVRDALEWSKQINVALYRFGREAEVMITAHSWPRWGNERIQEVLRAQRDAYAHLNNNVLNLANQGVTINEIHNVYRLPENLQSQWAARSYHGSEGHNSRAVLNRYLGYWDANPATLLPLSPREAAPLYVEMMGGPERILTKGRELYEAGRYRHAQEILNKLVFAQPGLQAARDLLADTWEQLGYQQESTSVRNSYLAGALELRSGIPDGVTPTSYGPDLVRAMSTGLWLDYLAVRLNSAKAADAAFVINIVTPDTGEQYVVELSHGTLTSIEGFRRADADLTVTIDRQHLEAVMTGQKTFADQVAAGKATMAGDAQVFARLLGMLDTFRLDFQILPGTGGTVPPQPREPADPIASRDRP